MVTEREWIAIEWLADARALLDWLNTIDSGPVLLMVRHSERPEDIDVPTTIRAELTEFGRKIALEFGRRIPKRWRISVYHSPHIRTTQTAKEIARGFQESEGILLELQELSVLLGGRGDIERIVASAYETGFDEFYWRWTRDEIPTETIEPIDDYLQRLTPQVISRFSKAGKDDLHIHVTHDTVIAASRGIYLDLSVDVDLAIPFLGGYGISRVDGKLVGFNNGKQVDVARNLFS
ncbi:MAG: histidine phosphatase family protein [Candidatus Thorarchaeota archaeon]